MSQQTTTVRGSVPSLKVGSEELLVETLKRCSRQTLDAALEFRVSNDVSLVPVIVLGIIERFLDPDVADQLRQLYEDVGGFGVLLAMGHEWDPKEKWLNSMTLLIDEVMPKLSDLT